MLLANIILQLCNPRRINCGTKENLAKKIFYLLRKCKNVRYSTIFKYEGYI